MRTLRYITLFLFASLFVVSCMQKTTPEVAVTPAVVQDAEVDSLDAERDLDKELDELGLAGEVRKDKQHVNVMNTGDFDKLRKYSVVVATLSKEEGVKRLTAAFDRDGIKHFVIKNAKGNRYFFVISSSDSEEVAMKARADFLITHTVNKSKSSIWGKYYIHLVDAYILEKK